MVKRSRLVFDSKAAQQDLTRRLMRLTDELIRRFYNEATQELGNYNDAEIEDAELIANMIRAKVIFNAKSILKSYGTGSLADKENPALQDYMINKELINPARRGMFITGRPAGEYMSVLGNKKSSGAMEGVVLEGFMIKPIAPTNSIKNAEIWLKAEDGYVQNHLEMEISDFVKSMGKYFRNV